MKAWGIVCIALGALWGMGVTVRERRRKRTAVADFRAALARMAEEIRISRVPLPALLDRLAEGVHTDAGTFFRRVAEGARHGRAPSALWRASLHELPLSASDCQTLSEFASTLRGDEEQIRRAAELAAERLEKSLTEMDSAARTDLQQSAALIFSAAALLAILLY